MTEQEEKRKRPESGMSAGVTAALIALILAVTAGGNGGVVHIAADLPVGKAQLAQHGDHRGHVVYIEGAVGNQLVVVALSVLAQRHGAGGNVHILRQIVGLGGVEGLTTAA